MTLGEKLSLLMKERRLSVKDIAVATGLPFRSISALLADDGRRMVDMSIVIPVRDFLGVTLEQLLDDRISYPFSSDFFPQEVGEKPNRANMAEYKYIELYNLPVSAGTGIYIEDSGTEMIKVEVSGKTSESSFALRVRGDSMSPVYHDRDIILIRSQPSVQKGQPGIFILNREAYFKILGDGCLYSLNPAFAPIPLREGDALICKGLVLCRLHKKE